MASNEQEEFEFRLRAEAEAASRKPAAPQETLGSTLLRGAKNTPKNVMDIDKSIMALPGVAADAILHPIRTGKAIGDAVGGMVDTAKGGIQRARELSPVDMRGDAPAMDTKAYDKFAEDNYNKYGTKQNLYKTAGDHPVDTALAVGSLVAPALKGVGAGEALGGLAGKAAEALGSSRAAEAVRTVTQAERRGKAIASTMQGQMQSAHGVGMGDAEAVAARDAARSTRAAAYAEKARARGKVLSPRITEALEKSVPAEPAIGEVRSLTDRGTSIREPALAREGEINDAMRKADAEHRGAMEAVAADRAAAGVGVSDTDVAKALIEKSKAKVRPDPVARPSVGKVPADSAGGKLHEELLKRLAPHEEALTIEQAKAARQAGIEVNTAPDGSFTRTVKPSLEDADNFRRYLGEVLNGKVEGYAGVSAAEAREMRTAVSDAMDEYAKGASKPVQDSWRAAKQKLEPYEKVRAGKAIVGTQPGTNVAAVPAASIPGRMIAGGADTVRQTMAVAGEAPVKAALRSHVQKIFKDAKSTDAAARKVAPGTPLGDAMAVDDELSAAVKDYLQQRQAADASGVQAKGLARRAATTSKRAEYLDKAAERLQGTSEKSAALARKHSAELADLDITAPKDVGRKYTKMLGEAREAGRITDAQYRQGLDLAARAEKEFGIKATRDKWMKGAATAAGVGVAYKAFPDITHVLGAH